MLNIAMAILQQTPIGRSDIFHALMDRVSDAAALDRSTLVVGARGTGKELIAARLHFLSPRWEQVFVDVNCAAYSEDLLDAHLFGRQYNDGGVDIEGQFLRADGGTLFLNHIEHVSPRLQQKMLQAFEQGVIDPLGSPDVTAVNVRVLAATSIDLRAAVAAGRFSQDLLDHLTFDVVFLPPLRNRADDIFALTEHFGRKAAQAMGAESFIGFSPDAMAFLARQPWPGNVRELRAAVERSVGQAFLRDETLSTPIDRILMDPFEGAAALAPDFASDGASDILPDITSSPAPDAGADVLPDDAPFQDRVMAFERSIIDRALNAHAHHQGKTADSLGLSYHAFRGLLRKHGLKK